MWDFLDSIIIVPIIGAFAYGLIRQIQETITLTKSGENDTKTLGWSRVCSVAYGVFLISYILNIAIALMGVNHTLFTSKNTSSLCIISLAVFFISKYGVDYKN